ncbi:MAG: hypothetical protein NZM18_04655 [Thermoflexales bacterium]|nr:hypothetical protein [Thermoflexales bacterium]MDW8350550.1 hypothetical protein [Anaerolineae bacterium]
MSEVKFASSSQGAHTPKITVKFLVDGQEVGTLVLSPKQFSTGSTGFFANGKVSLGDEAEKGYQAQVQLVRIGSKPK